MRVALADDAVVLREGLARVLAEAGVEVAAQAGTADELLEVVEELRPDVAVIDIRMPPTWSDEGLAVAEEIRRGSPRSACCSLAIRRAGLRAGAARGRQRRRRLLAQGAGARRRRPRHRARPDRRRRDRRRPSPRLQLLQRPARTARSTSSPRESERSSPHGRGPHRPRHLRAALRDTEHRRDARPSHHRQARASGDARRQPTGPRRPRIPPLGRGRSAAPTALIRFTCGGATGPASSVRAVRSVRHEAIRRLPDPSRSPTRRVPPL